MPGRAGQGEGPGWRGLTRWGGPEGPRRTDRPGRGGGGGTRPRGPQRWVPRAGGAGIGAGRGGPTRRWRRAQGEGRDAAEPARPAPPRFAAHPPPRPRQTPGGAAPLGPVTEAQARPGPRVGQGCGPVSTAGAAGSTRGRGPAGRGERGRSWGRGRPCGGGGGCAAAGAGGEEGGGP